MTPAGSETVTINELGFFVWVEGGWVFSDPIGEPFTAQHFAEWFGRRDAQIRPGRECTASENWRGGDVLETSRTRWYYIGVTNGCQRVKGEATIETLAEVDTTKVP